MPIETLKSAIRDVPDFPEPGIVFKDITPILSCPNLFSLAVENMILSLGDVKIDKIVGIDARGFIFGAAMADRLKCGFTPARKAGKLPWDTIQETYSLEYGEATLEMHKDAVKEGETVAIVDDLLATGGTSKAAANLVHRLGGKIHSISFFVELKFLPGRDVLKDFQVHSLLQY
ncbi:MAG: adenine phosphoribosyltransferase [Lentisphaeraceae bacterium]|nr:adenine phosphoribosyltransferase [Lentisphaeraceae bacterium]